ncbi:MAG: chitobiase/beta-hexosaminidase C-terminal domain-containing protein [Treponema sp.]|nr:chitobiase/beta-hexosaminidase C-terminal domain-containing protein [Candidatus Treponema merdequi]
MRREWNLFAVAICLIAVCFVTGCSSPVLPDRVATPVFSKESGVVENNDSVEISCETQGAVIYYTTDGTVPNAGSIKYDQEQKILISKKTTIKAIAIKEGMTPSNIETAVYLLNGFTIIFDSNGHGESPMAYLNKHKGDQITLPQALTAEGFIFDNWTDGTDTYAAGSSYTVTHDTMFKANWIALNTVKTPIFENKNNKIDKNEKITISCETEGAAIYYTTDGTDPTTSSTQYTGPVEITADTTIKAIAVKAGMNNSSVETISYVLKTYSVLYSLNGHGSTTPEPVYNKYKGDKITLPQALTDDSYFFESWTDGINDYKPEDEYTVKDNVLIKANWIAKNKVAKPIFDEKNTVVNKGDSVTLSCTTEGATIYYTTDGNAPTSLSTQYTGPIEITADTTIKAIAVKDGMADSDIAEITYLIKVYVITFNQGGHGKNPNMIKCEYAESVTLPQPGPSLGWDFIGWNSGLELYQPGDTFKNTYGSLTMMAEWKDGPVVSTSAELKTKMSQIEPYDKIFIIQISDENPDIAKIAEALRENENIRVNLDLLNCTGLKKLEDTAFGFCNNLIAIKIPKNLEAVGMAVFAYCENLENIVVDPESTTFDNRENCNAIIKKEGNILVAGCKNTVCPGSVSEIGDGAFYGCKSLTSINPPIWLTKVGRYAFYDCVNLQSFPQCRDLRCIDEAAFMNCESIKGITLRVDQIGRFAFKGCTKMKEIAMVGKDQWYRSKNRDDWINKTKNGRTEWKVINMTEWDNNRNAKDITGDMAEYYLYR